MRARQPFAVLAFCIVAVGQLFTQTPRAAIFGRVVDAASHEPLPNVNVFLTGTSLGAATDGDGKFEIRNVPFAAYELIVSMVGYRRKVIQLLVFEPSEQRVDVQLEQTAIETPEVVVVAKDPKEWRKNFERFRAEFLGNTRNAGLCRILNPEVLDLLHDDRAELFVANADVPLQIENRALGYKIHFMLEEFRMEKGTLQYKAKTRFEELQPASRVEQNAWVLNREKAYYGSRRHFLKALAQRRTTEEGFDVHQVPNLRPSTSAYKSARLLADTKKMVMGTEHDFQKRLAFPDYLEIVYTKEPAEASFQYEANPFDPGSVRQISWLAMNRLSVLFSTDGNTLDTYSLKTFGYWAYERVAELLPIDYEP